MRIALLDNRSTEVSGEAGNYVAELAPLLATDHRVTVLTIQSTIARLPGEIVRIRRMAASDMPEVIHLNNLSGPTLAAVLWAVDQQRVGGRRPIALGLHDDRLLKKSAWLNRILTRSVGLILSPSSELLDRHLARDFFPHTMHEVIPYEMPYHADRLVSAYRRLLIDRRTGDLGRVA